MKRFDFIFIKSVCGNTKRDCPPLDLELSGISGAYKLFKRVGVVIVLYERRFISYHA